MVPLDVETNHADVVSIQRPNDENITVGGHRKLLLEVWLHLFCNRRHRNIKLDSQDRFMFICGGLWGIRAVIC